MDFANNLKLRDVLQLPDECFEQSIEPEQRKALIERAIRSKALKLGGTAPKVDEVSPFVEFVVNLAKQEICSKTIAIQILQDIFDVSSVDSCERLFGIVEDDIDTWKTPFFFDSCKNLVLRMCNDLLKRLSRTVNTTFCGRILILLANFLPFTEKSGLNLTGQFNTFNVTTYDREKKDYPFEEMNHQPNVSTTVAAALAGDDDVEVGEIREHRDMSGAISVDYNLYVKFWEMQKFFANPNLLFEYNAFKSFHEVLSEFLTIFSSNQPLAGHQQQHQFFAKYLTSQKLFPLQLSDSQFRRYFILQYLIIANYLLLKVKLKDNFTLTALQEEEVRQLSDKCFVLLRLTHPNGPLFADSVKKVLSRERLWSAWKNEGCPDLIGPLLNAQSATKYIRFKRKTVCQMVPDQMDLGNTELTRLWNIQPNNLLACKEQQRNCAPDLVQFLSDALDEMDPEQQMDEQYQCVNDETYQWMGSRFLLLTSDQYMSSAAQDSSRLLSSTSNALLDSSRVSSLGPNGQDSSKSSASTANASTTSTSIALFLKKTIQLTAENVPALKERAEHIQLALKKKENAERLRLAAEAKELEKSERKKGENDAAAAAKKGAESDAPVKKGEGGDAAVKKSDTDNTAVKKGGGDSDASSKKVVESDGAAAVKKSDADAMKAEKERKRESDQSADRRMKRRRERGTEKPKKRRTEEENGTT